MRRLELNFQKPPNRPSRTAGWVLLLTGFALLIEMGVSYDRLQNDREAMNQEIKTSHIRLDTQKNDSINQYADKDFEEARQIINRLATPWDAIFVGLESLKNSNVAILSIQPDMKTGVLQIEGEAKDYAAVLTLIAQLRVTKPFSDVFLLRHEIKRDDPQHPVSFALSMHWTKPS
jgi:Tfp pilus assembly protein PilN